MPYTEQEKGQTCPSNFNAKHWDELVTKGGIAPDIVKLNFQTIDDPHEIDQFLGTNTDSRWKHSKLGPGWAVRGVDPETGENFGLGSQFKPDEALVIKGKPLKYFSPTGYESSPLFVDPVGRFFWEEAMKATDIPIVLTEGAKKAAYLITLYLVAISFSGVCNWGSKTQHPTIPNLNLKTLHKRLAPFCQTGRRVYLAYDGDWRTNPNVKAQLVKLGKKLQQSGCDVRVVVWDEAYKGIDDLGNAMGPQAVHDAIAQALTYEEWLEQSSTNESKALTEDKGTKAQRDYRRINERMGDRLSYNLLSTCVELDRQPFALGDAKLSLEIHHDVRPESSDQSVASIVQMVARLHEYNPVQEYLTLCRVKYADSPILDGLAEKLFGTDDPIHQTYLVRWLIAACARACNPGCSSEHVLILQGDQGCGKSSFFRNLAGPQWFNDNHPPMGDKDFKLSFYGKWIHEWGEVEAVFGKKGTSSIKSFISAEEDRIRKPYARDHESLKRSWIICASTNQTEFLRDPTGNRRFWIIPATQTIPFEWVTAHRDEIWGAAMALYKIGQQWWLTDLEGRQQADDSKRWQETDIYEDEFHALLDGQKECIALEVCTKVLNIENPSQKDKHRAAAMLERNGWKLYPNPRAYGVQGKRRVWFNPNAEQQVMEMEAEQKEKNIF